MKNRWVSAVLLALASVASGDVLVLSDGTRLEGELRHVDTGWDVVRPDGTIEHVSSQRVVSIQRGGGPLTAADAMGRFASLKRSLEIETNPAKAIDRYQRFIDQNPDPAADEAAASEMKIWKDRADRGLVKWGKDWLTADERTARLAQGTALALDARLMIHDNRLADAEGVLNDVLTGDPQHVSALYLMGYLQFHVGKVPEARKHFTTLQQLLPDHAPTLYDLGLVLMRQKQWGQAMSMFDQAMSAAPGSRFLVDNIAEILNQLPDEERRGTIYQKLLKHYADEEQQVGKEMAKQKKFRWGSGWVDQETHDKLVAAEAEVRKKMIDMDADFKASKERLTDIDRSITHNRQSMDEIESTSYYRNADGQMVRTTLPTVYYDLGREVERLKRERTEVDANIAKLQASAKTIQQQIPKPKFTGVIEPINEDGVPVRGLPPTTQPTTAPAAPPGNIDIHIGPADPSPHQ